MHHTANSACEATALQALSYRISAARQFARVHNAGARRIRRTMVPELKQEMLVQY